MLGKEIIRTLGIITLDGTPGLQNVRKIKAILRDISLHIGDVFLVGNVDRENHRGKEQDARGNG